MAMSLPPAEIGSFPPFSTTIRTGIVVVNFGGSVPPRPLPALESLRTKLMPEMVVPGAIVRTSATARSGCPDSRSEGPGVPQQWSSVPEECSRV